MYQGEASVVQRDQGTQTAAYLSAFFFFCTFNIVKLRDEVWYSCFLIFMIMESQTVGTKADFGPEMYFVWHALDF